MHRAHLIGRPDIFLNRYSQPLNNKKDPIRTTLVLALLFLCLAFPASSSSQQVAATQSSEPGTLADYQRARQFLPGNLRHSIYVADVSPHWIDKTNRFWYHKVSPKGSEFILVDAERNTAGPAFDHEKLAAALNHVTHREYPATDLPFDTIEFTDNQKAVRFHLEDQQWTCTLADYDCKPGPKDDSDAALSPDKRWNALVKDHNLYVKNASTGTVVQLTQDGVSGCDYATPLPALRLMVEQETEDVKQPAMVFWSPDSTKLITYRTDSRNSGRFTSLQFVPSDQLRPKAYSVVYPLPGEVLATSEPVIFEIPSGKRINVKSPPIELPFQDGPEFEWSPDSRTIFYDYDERGFKAREIRTIDPETGEQEAVVREHSNPYVDPGQAFYRFDHATGEVIVASERDGWNHLYLYSKTGQLENQITQGQWVVRQIEYLDEGNRQVYFLASGREKGEDPYLTHHYRVGFDGKSVTLVTPESANHSVSMSPDGAYFVDNYSRVDLPAESVLRRRKDGSQLRVLEKTDVSALQNAGWKFAESFQGKAADGITDLYGLIWKPSNFDPAKKYPIIEHVYTGPQGFFVPKTFRSTLWEMQSVAELGFVVVMIDGRGTAGRSRAFQLFSYRNLGGAFEDHVAMIKQMVARFPYMDIDRVGIFGTSAGGYGAAHAMLVFPEFYKVGVTISADHDARLDKAWWNELYQGYPVQDDYAAQSNVTMADRLRGHLLIEHGDIDDNVHPVETMRFVDALMSANKQFDMLLVPNMYHGESGPHAPYIVKRRWDYFVQYLLGVAPPKDFSLTEEDLSDDRRRRNFEHTMH